MTNLDAYHQLISSKRVAFQARGFQNISDTEILPGLFPQCDCGEYDAAADFKGSIEDSYAAVRERVANGGDGWNPPS